MNEDVRQTTVERKNVYSQTTVGMNLSHHPTSAGLLRVKNTEKRRNIQKLHFDFMLQTSNIICIIDFHIYLHLSSKLPLPEVRADSLLPGKPEPPNHPNFLLLTSFLLHRHNFHV